MIIEQSKYNDEDIIEIEKDWKILTFDMVLPFGLVGFLAEVSKVLADEKIPIFAISAYSTDRSHTANIPSACNGPPTSLSIVLGMPVQISSKFSFWANLLILLAVSIESPPPQ